MRKMLGNKHLHIDHGDQLSDWLSKALRSMKDGSVTIELEGKQAAKIAVGNDNITIDLLKADVFKIPEDETGLFDKIKTASEFGHKLSDNGVTLTFLRRGKEAMRLGKGAKPTLSKVITRSDDIQMNSVREFAKLKGDFKAD
jgi:hypothetical protein